MSRQNKKCHLGRYQHTCTDFHNNDNGVCIIAYLIITKNIFKRNRVIFADDPIGWINIIKSILKSCDLKNIWILRCVSFIYWHQYFSYKKVPVLIRVSFFLLEPSLREDWLMDVMDDYEIKKSGNHAMDFLKIFLPYAFSLIWQHFISANIIDILIISYSQIIEVTRRIFKF